MHRPVCVRPVQKPKLFVFSLEDSYLKVSSFGTATNTEMGTSTDYITSQLTLPDVDSLQLLYESPVMESTKGTAGEEAAR